MPIPSVEIVRPGWRRGEYKSVLFDFDGTLSMIREGWSRVMVGMMVEELRRFGATGDDLPASVESFVMALNGRPAINQMNRLVEEVAAHGGVGAPAAEYLAEYDRRLLALVAERVDAIQSRRATHAAWAVPGTHALLAELRRLGLPLYLASGTRLSFVRSESELLQVADFFDGEIHAPEADDSAFTKRAIIDRILADRGIDGVSLLSFGDGVVETQEVWNVGGTAVAVCSEEAGGRVNLGKRERLIAAGADLVIADYSDLDGLMRCLFDD